MKTLTISLSPHQLDTLQSAVASGSYASASEVVRDALRLWEQREEFRNVELEALRRAYDEGRASGEGRHQSAADFLAQVKATRSGA